MNQKFLSDLHDTRDAMHDTAKHLDRIAKCLSETGNTVLSRNVACFATVIRKDINDLVDSYATALGISVRQDMQGAIENVHTISKETSK